MSAAVKVRKAHIANAAEARSNLIVFHAVVALLESGTIVGDQAQRDAEKIIRICREAGARQLRYYDAYVKAGSVEVLP